MKSASILIGLISLSLSSASAQTLPADPAKILEQAKEIRMSALEMMQILKAHIDGATPPVRHSIGVHMTGNVVNRVIRNSPAHLAGLNVEDALLEVNGQTVNEYNAAQAIAAGGESVSLKIVSHGVEKTVGPVAKADVRFYFDGFAEQYGPIYADLMPRLQAWSDKLNTTAEPAAAHREGLALINEIVSRLSRPIGMWLFSQSIGS